MALNSDTITVSYLCKDRMAFTFSWVIIRDISGLKLEWKNVKLCKVEIKSV